VTAAADRGRAPVAALVAAAVAVALGAQVSVPVPGSPVPQSLQTLAVVLVGAWLGSRGGAIALSVYIVAGALGAPLFADGAGGAEHLTGPTVGYLVGFVVAAPLVGWWFRHPWGRGVVGAFAGAVVAHAWILGLGWARLGAMVGPIVAWETGVAPFLVGGLAKSAVAALAWLGIRSRAEPVAPLRRPSPSPPPRAEDPPMGGAGGGGST